MKDSKFNRRNATALTWVFLLAVGAVLSIRTTHALTTTTSRHVHSLRKASLSKFSPRLHTLQIDPRKQQQNGGMVTRSTTGTELFMYNLPPGGGGGGNNGLGDIAKGILGLVLVVGFFASPLGGLVLGVFNSLLLLSILAPILIGIAFQTWQFLNTIEAPCPNCGATVKVIKTNKETGEAVPTLCYSCGAILQANYDNTGIDNVTGRKSVMDDASAMNSIFDIFGGSPGGAGGVGGSAFDVTETTTTTTTTTTTDVIQERGKKENRPKRDQNVIDVEIEDDDGKPWQ